MMVKKLFAALGLLGLLVGCVAPPTGREPLNEIMTLAGPEPTQEAVEQAVLGRLNDVLKDPDSVKQFAVESRPVLATWYRGMVNGGRYDQGWLVCFRYNAKNSYGAYTGVQRDGFMLRESNGSYYVVLNVNWPLASARC